MATKQAQQFEFRTELRGLIRLLAKHLYANEDVFVRELIQNAHDAINRRREIHKENAPAGVIRVRVDKDAQTITFTDNGAGLTEQEIHDYLATIGKSGTDEFRQDLMKHGRQASVNLIGQFGIGLLSAFIVSKRVLLETLSCHSGNSAWQWESSGDKDYVLAPGLRDEIGTSVTLYISDEYRDVLDLDFLRNSIRKYADFLPVEIYLNDEEAPVNSINAPWHKTFSKKADEIQELLVFIARRFPGEYPLEVIPIHIRTTFRADGVLYISDRSIPFVETSGQVDIYQSRMFIQASNNEILPAWAKFVRGVIDSPDLTPNAARDAVQRDGVFNAIKESLGKAIVDHLKQLARENPHHFQRVMLWHQYHIKGMALTDNEFFKEIADLVPFDTNQGVCSLQAYLERAPVIDERRSLVYFNERGSALQYYMLCNAKGLLVINASLAFEENFLKRYVQLHPEIRLHQINIAESEFIFEKLDDRELPQFRQLELVFEALIGNELNVKPRVVRFRPDSVPAVVTLSPDAKALMELQATRDNWRVPESVREIVGKVLEERPLPLTLYFNANNSIIQQLSRMNLHSTAATRSLTAIYNNALLLARHEERIHPRDAEKMVHGFNEVINLFIAQTAELEQMRGQLSAMQITLQEQREQQRGDIGLTQHVSCFVALPFDKKYDLLFEALQELFENKPYFWEVIRADEHYVDDKVIGNIQKLMKRSHCYIAEITDANPSVMIELGMMQMYSDRPTFLLRQQGKGEDLPANLRGVIYLAYPETTDLARLVEALREEFSKAENIKQIKGKTRHLSPVIMRLPGIDRSATEAIAKAIETVEEFVTLDPQIVAQKTGISTFIVQALQEHIRKI